ncbi:hypothetical protein ACFV2Z_11255 [Streptomyces sp. NPDC059688]|uniref:hypothetical protein n=1 Tax=Streptomyces sp. NPDC059688 TaxID=3346906 RepID=UPI0036998536
MAASAPGTGAGRRVRHGAPSPAAQPAAYTSSTHRPSAISESSHRRAAASSVPVPPGLVGARAARELGLAVDGVNYHLRRLSARWGAANSTELVARAYALSVLVPGVWPPETRPDGVG